MNYNYLNDSEVALALAGAIRKWRIEPSGAGMTQKELALKSGVALSSLKRFEKTGNMTLGSFIGVLRGLSLLDRLEGLVPSPDVPGPLELLEREREASPRERAPRSKREN